MEFPPKFLVISFLSLKAILMFQLTENINATFSSANGEYFTRHTHTAENLGKNGLKMTSIFSLSRIISWLFSYIKINSCCIVSLVLSCVPCS